MNVLVYRNLRRKIAGICDNIYQQKWNVVCIDWCDLRQELLQINPDNEKWFWIIRECNLCTEIGNFIYLHDLLIYDVDAYIAQQLYGLNEEIRKFLSEEAKKKNREALEVRHKNISVLLYKENRLSRVKCFYMGTENISISIMERSKEFKLFSDTNPWMESISMVKTGSLQNSILEEICVLGWGGGHLIRELETRYPQAQINVYLPNMDIFETVMSNILVTDVLENEKMVLYFDPTGLDFLSVLEKNAKRSEFGYFINRQELRACVKNLKAADGLIKFCRRKYDIDLTREKFKCNTYESEDLASNKIGTRIYELCKKFEG